LYLAVGDIEFSFSEVRTTFALTVLDPDVVVSGLVVRPIARALFTSLLQIRQHHQSSDALLGNHPPEVSYCAFERVLRDDERLGVVIPLEDK